MLVTNIEENTYTLQTEKKETLKVTLNDDLEITNKRTEESFEINNIKINDKLDFENVYKRQGKIVLTEETKVNVIRNIHGEELREEVLSDSYINFDLENIEKSGNNYKLKGKATDWYYTNEGEEINVEVIVNNQTQILGIVGNPEEQLKQVEKNTMYITLDKDELKKGNLVATNIEGMGC